MDQLRNFGYLVKDTSRLYTLHFERHAVDYGVTLGQCKVLGALRRNEGISQVRLAELTDTDPMTLVRMLDRMETSGLVERRPDPHDRRASRLYMQAGAAPTLDAIARTHDRALAEAMAGLAGDERKLLLDLLQKVHVNLDALHAADAATKHRKCDTAATSAPAVAAAATAPAPATASAATAVPAAGTASGSAAAADATATAPAPVSPP